MSIRQLGGDLWKAWMLRRGGDVMRAWPPFWQAPLTMAANRVAASTASQLVTPLIQATDQLRPATLAAAGSARSSSRARCATRCTPPWALQFGQVLLATVGPTAPFVGLLGTVWASTMR